MIINSLLICLLGATSHALEFKIETQQRPLTQLKPGQILYSYKTLIYSDWPNGSEKRVLNLFPGFRDGEGYKQSLKPVESNALVVFIAHARIVLDRQSNQINLSSFLRLAAIQKLQTGLAEVTQLPSADIETYRRTFLSYRNRPDRWCENSATSLCLESNYILDENVQALMALLLYFRKKAPDPVLRSQSEVRVETPTDSAQIAALKSLTGIATEPGNVVTQNIFWFNHVMEFAKVVGIVQAHPTDPGKTVITGYTVFAVERKWWDEKMGPIPLHMIFLGQRLNTSSGLLMGLPKVTQQVFKSMAEMISDAK